MSKWFDYPADYRKREIGIISDWIRAGESGTILGMPGTGRAAMLAFLCQRPHLVDDGSDERLSNVWLVPAGLNDLPDSDPATIYRIILRSFYEYQIHVPAAWKHVLRELYSSYMHSKDTFFLQSKLRELLMVLDDGGVTVVLVMNRFDLFCQHATAQMLRSLISLRDQFRETLLFIAGMKLPLIYNHSDNLEPMRHIIDSHVCWVQPLSEKDATYMIAERTATWDTKLTAEQITSILDLSGGNATIIRVLLNEFKRNEFEFRVEMFKRSKAVQHRLGTIWNGFSEQEQLILWHISEGTYGDVDDRVVPGIKEITKTLVSKGICKKREDETYKIVGTVIADHVRLQKKPSWGRIYYDDATEMIYKGRTPLKLGRIPKKLLRFMIDRPHQPCTHQQLLDVGWPEDLNATPERLYQHFTTIRREVESDSDHIRYVVTIYDHNDGAYVFYPEGCPVDLLALRTAKKKGRQ